MLSSVLWWVPIVAGLEDAINPCIFITSGFLIVWLVWIAQKKLSFSKHGFVFIALLYALTLIFNIGIAQGLLYSVAAQQLIHAAYVFLGFLMIAISVIFIRDWFQLTRGQSQDLLSQRWWEWGNCYKLIIWLMTVVWAILFAVLASIWPMNFYMGVIVNNVFLPGQFWVTVFWAGIYTFFLLIPVYLSFILLRMFKSNARLFYVIAAAICCSGGVGAIYIFK